METIAVRVEKAGVSVTQLAATAGLDPKLVKAIVAGNYTPSPVQREKLASALGVSPGDISWGHAVPVEHLRGNGPQCGRNS
jgi:ribosome-binding protein aMBF1 (putative translation factor)